MIYLFGIGSNVSVVYKGSTLSEKDKAKATLVVESLPQPEAREGFMHQINIDPETKKIFYTYHEIEDDEEVSEDDG